MPQFADRVKISSSTTGTGTLTLGSAISGFQSIPASLDGEIVGFVIENGNSWELSQGTYTHSGTTLSRTYRSSSTGALLNLSGTSTIFLTPAAADLQTVHVYSAASDLPSASANHGKICHVHSLGRMVFAHGGSWINLANASEIVTYVHPNHTGEVTSAADGATVIADNVVDEANLKVSNSPTNGYVLTAQSGNTGGLTWAAASSGGGGGSATSALSEQEFTATANQTVFTVSGGITNAANVAVFLNGSKLGASDYTASASSNNVTLAAGATVGDLVEISEFGQEAGGASVTSSDTAPSSPSAGDLWFDSSTAELLVYYADGSSNQWVTVSGEQGPQGVSGTTNSVGTVSGNNLDLATGNFFEVAANNQTLTFSNAPAVHKFNVKITGSSVTTGFDLATASYDSASFSFASQDSTPKGVRFGDSGTRMFMVGGSSYRIYSYTLSTAYDITTASYDNKNLSILNETQGGAVAVDFNANGTKMFTTGFVTDAVHEYALSTAYDVTTASHTGSHSTSSQDTNPLSVVFHPSGTSFYSSGTITDKVFQYSMSTAFDVSTASYSNKSFQFTSQDNQPEGVCFSTDGTKMFLAGRQNNSVFEYALSTAYDVSTASYSNKSFSVAAQDNYTQEIIFNANGTKFYILGSQNDKIYQYSCGGTATKTVTFPSAVTFESGSAPTPPANAAIKTVKLYTVNSGTNYYDL